VPTRSIRVLRGLERGLQLLHVVGVNFGGSTETVTLWIFPVKANGV